MVIKLVFAGLDAAGKTSLLLALREQYSGLSRLTPTKGRERSKLDFLGAKILAWDLGGQEQYREVYVDRPELYFGDTDVLFYVVDVQDEARFAESEAYFAQVVETFQKLAERPPVVVCVHKYDPDLLGDESILERERRLKESFSRLSGELELSFERTTIFDRRTLEEAFSRGLNLISDVAGILAKLLETYSTAAAADAIALLDSRGLVLARHAKEAHDEVVLLQTALLLLSLFSFHHDAGFEERDSFVLEYGSRAFLMSRVKRTEEKSYFAWVLTRDLEACRASLDVLKEDLIPLVGFHL